MNEKIISELGKDEACVPSLFALRSMNTAQMLKHYIDKIDFSICSDLLSADFILKNSTKQERNINGIYLSENISKANPSLNVLMGACDMGMVCSGFNVAQLFLRDDSICNLNACDDSFTIIDCFGESKINIMQRGNANVIVNIYGKSVVDILSSERMNNIKINIKHKDKY